MVLIMWLCHVLSLFWLVILFDLFQGATFSLLHVEVEEDDAKKSEDTVEQKHSPQAQTGLQAEECLGGEEPHDVGDCCCYTTGETASSDTDITVCRQTVKCVLKCYENMNRKEYCWHRYIIVHYNYISVSFL